MQHAKRLALIALALHLMGCSGFGTAGDVSVPALPGEVSNPCEHPADLMGNPSTMAEVEIAMGRIGDELIRCGTEKDVAVGAYEELADALEGK